MNPICPICKQSCQPEVESSYSKFVCDCQRPSTDPTHTFTCYRMGWASPCYYYEFYFREPNKLHLNFSYGNFSIFYRDRENTQIDVLIGNQQLSPWDAYELLQRYNNLKAFI